MGFRTYNLNDDEIRGLANLALQEQGKIDGACAELSLMANLFERQSKFTTLYDYVRNGKWFYRAAYYMDNGEADETYRQYARYVLCHGLRTVPGNIDEHDCFSDIQSISTGSVRDRSAYIRDETYIKNSLGSAYWFYCFPTSSGDPFGYTAQGEKMNGKLQNIIDKERELANIPYEETGNNHQVFSSTVNNAGLEGCQNEPWCCTYQFALELMEFGVDEALKHWHMTRDTYCGYSCFETYAAFNAADEVGTVPRLGALVVFKHSHIGRVLSINYNNYTFECGEGNTSNAAYERNGNCCAVKTYSWDDSKILGFCYINYDDDDLNRFTGVQLLVAIGQSHSNGFLGDSHSMIDVDGIRGRETTRQMIKVLQHAANLDWDAGLEEDGVIGVKTAAAFANHYIKLGECQYMVTAVEICMYCMGRDPNGVEYPGIFGNGLAKAAASEYITGEEILALVL